MPTKIEGYHVSPFPTKSHIWAIKEHANRRQTNGMTASYCQTIAINNGSGINRCCKFILTGKRYKISQLI